MLIVTANEKPSNLPLNASNPLTAMMSGGKDLKAAQQGLLVQAMAQKVIAYSSLLQLVHDRVSLDSLLICLTLDLSFVHRFYFPSYCVVILFFSCHE